MTGQGPDNRFTCGEGVVWSTLGSVSFTSSCNCITETQRSKVDNLGPLASSANAILGHPLTRRQELFTEVESPRMRMRARKANNILASLVPQPSLHPHLANSVLHGT